MITSPDAEVLTATSSIVIAVMRNTLIFAGNSCPVLAGQICENLGMVPADAELTQFSNVSSQASPDPTRPAFAFVAAC